MTQINTTNFSEQDLALMEVSMTNCYLIFDPTAQLSRQQLIDIVDTEVRIDYYITLFIGNTVDMLEGENQVTVEMISKIGKFLREIKSKPKRERIFTALSTKIRNLALSFTPLMENPEFLEVWS